jgi:hypothetical protein
MMKVAFWPVSSNIDIVDLKPESRRKKHPKRCNDPQKAALPVRGLENDDHQIDVWLVFRGDALQQRALLFGGARRRLAAQFPIAMLGISRRLGKPRQARSPTAKYQ